MTEVVSLGRVNVDHVIAAGGVDVEGHVSRYEWFPHSARDVRFDDVPAANRPPRAAVAVATVTASLSTRETGGADRAHPG